MLVAGPAYLAKFGQPETVESLAKHQFVLYSAEQAKADIEFADGSRFPYQKLNSRLYVNSLYAILQLVRENTGIHWGPTWLYQKDLESGRLVQVLPGRPVKGFTVYAVYPAREFLSQKTQLFLQLLEEELMLCD